MKQILLILLLSFSLTSFSQPLMGIIASGGNNVVTPTRNIFDYQTAYYKLDESSGAVIDQIHANNLTATNATTGVSGHLNTAYSFAGTGYVASAAHINAISTENITVSAWIKLSTDGFYGIVSNFYNPSNGWWFGTQSVSSHPKIIFGAYNSSTSALAIGTTSLDTGNWIFVTGTFDGFYVRVYVNGVLDATSTLFNYPINYNGSEKLYIASRGPSTILMRGAVDEVRIFSIALTDIEVFNLYSEF